MYAQHPRPEMLCVHVFHLGGLSACDGIVVLDLLPPESRKMGVRLGPGRHQLPEHQGWKASVPLILQKGNRLKYWPGFS